MKHSEMVREFHEAFGAPVRREPGIDVPEVPMRLALIAEEHAELLEAVREGDIVEVADALGDLLYVIHGAALTFGIDLDAVVEEIHASNMRKLGPDGKPILRADGKFMKPDGWVPPDIAGVLARQRGRA